MFHWMERDVRYFLAIWKMTSMSSNHVLLVTKTRIIVIIIMIIIINNNIIMVKQDKPISASITVIKGGPVKTKK